MSAHGTSGVAVVARKGKDKMTGRGKFAFLMASLAAVSVVSAPVASARPTCQDTATKTICTTNGSTSIKARPGTTAPPANQPVFPWLGMPGARR
jgi:F420-0:gamma-glutamyl ligase-like protein